MCRSYLSTAIALLAVHLPASAADLSKIDRTIGKEPVYGSQSKPKYCLLAYGPEAKARVWLVLDGEVLYVDRNGNGDLTEDGKRFAGKETAFHVNGDSLKGKGLSFDIGEIPAFGKELTHHLFVTLYQEGKGD